MELIPSRPPDPPVQSQPRSRVGTLRLADWVGWGRVGARSPICSTPSSHQREEEVNGRIRLELIPTHPPDPPVQSQPRSLIGTLKLADWVGWG